MFTLNSFSFRSPYAKETVIYIETDIIIKGFRRTHAKPSRTAGCFKAGNVVVVDALVAVAAHACGSCISCVQPSPLPAAAAANNMLSLGNLLFAAQISLPQCERTVGRQVIFSSAKMNVCESWEYLFIGLASSSLNCFLFCFII